jgi:NADH:ubiquinone reductase (H+-translocating)
MARTTVAQQAHRVVVVGSGFGGLFATRALGGAPVTVTVIDRTNHHLFQPLLYQVATGILSAGEIAPATRDVLQRQANAEVLIGDVIDIDIDARLVVSEILGQRTTTPYDSLIVAGGSTTSYFGHDEYATHAPGLKTIDDALELKGRVFGAFEMAELEPDPVRRKHWLTFVVVGGGPTGVEMAGQIAELSRRTLRRNFRRFDPTDAKVILIDGGKEILSGFGDRLSGAAYDELRRLGVEIHLGAMVTGIDATGVDVKSDDPALGRIDAAVKVWAAGVKASGLGQLVATRTGTSMDKAGRVEVQPDCSVPGHPEIFVVGDLMALDDLPGVAEVAMQSGMFASLTIRRRLDGKRPPARFKYRDLGTLASVGRFWAVASIGPLRVSGLPGWLLWLGVHLVFLTGFKNRAYTVSHWAVSFVGRARSERTITYRQVFAREAEQGADAELGTNPDPSRP